MIHWTLWESQFFHNQVHVTIDWSMQHTRHCARVLDDHSPLTNHNVVVNGNGCISALCKHSSKQFTVHITRNQCWVFDHHACGGCLVVPNTRGTILKLAHATQHLQNLGSCSNKCSRVWELVTGWTRQQLAQTSSHRHFLSPPHPLIVSPMVHGYNHITVHCSILGQQLG